MKPLARSYLFFLALLIPLLAGCAGGAAQPEPAQDATLPTAIIRTTPTGMVVVPSGMPVLPTASPTATPTPPPTPTTASHLLSMNARLAAWTSASNGLECTSENRRCPAGAAAIALRKAPNAGAA